MSFSSRKHLERYYEETDLLDTIGLNGEEKLSPRMLLAQAKELLTLFLEMGGADVNLLTTGAGRTVFHLAISSEVIGIRKKIRINS